MSACLVILVSALWVVRVGYSSLSWIYPDASERLALSLSTGTTDDVALRLFRSMRYM